MRLLSRKLLVYAVVIFAALFTVGAYASEQIGSYPGNSDSSPQWWAYEEDTYKAPFESKDEYVVLTIPSIITSDEDSEETWSVTTIEAPVSYDFSGIVWPVAENPLRFYPSYTDAETEGTATFFDADHEELTASKINSLISASDKVIGGYIVMTLSTDMSYSPLVTVRHEPDPVASFTITPESTDVVMIPASGDRVTLMALNSSGSVSWEIVNSWDRIPVADWSDYETPSYYESIYKVKASIVSTDEHTAVLSLDVPALADEGQYGLFDIVATDASSGATAQATVFFKITIPLRLEFSQPLVSVDLNDSVRVTLTVPNAYGYVNYTLEDPCLSFDWPVYSSMPSSIDIIVSPKDPSLEGATHPASVTATDANGKSGRGTINIHIYGPLSVDASSKSFTVSSSDVPNVEFTTSEASGDVSFDLSVPWAKVSGSKFVVVSVDSEFTAKLRP